MVRAKASIIANLLLAVILLGLFVNLSLSYYIQSMKERNFALIPLELRGKCFEGAEGGAGCGAVQTSDYSSTFGVSNPHYGYVGFSALFILVLLAAYGRARKAWWHGYVAQGTLIGLLIGSAFSIWLLYVQFFLIKTTCVYCLWVDAIMVFVTVLFAWLFRRELA